MRHRARALQGARTAIASGTRYLFGTTPLYAFQDPAREYQTEQRIQALTAKLTTEAEAEAAFDKCLNRPELNDGLAMAGGIAAIALAKGWEGILGNLATTRRTPGRLGGCSENQGSPGPPGWQPAASTSGHAQRAGNCGPDEGEGYA